jgi:hypothetical protein
MLSGFTGPVEVVAGECSPLPRQAAGSTAAVFPDAQLTIVPGAGHQVWHEAPGCLAAALSRVAARLGRELIEDLVDAAAAREALAEPGADIPAEQVWAELGLT